IARVGTEINGGKPQGDAAPVIGAAAHDAGAKPAKIGPGRGGVRFAVNIPRTVGSEEFAEVFGLLAGDAHTTMWQIVGPHKHLEVFFGMDLWAGFEHGDVEAAFGKDFGGHAAACARTD